MCFSLLLSMMRKMRRKSGIVSNAQRGEYLIPFRARGLFRKAEERGIHLSF